MEVVKPGLLTFKSKAILPTHSPKANRGTAEDNVLYLQSAPRIIAPKSYMIRPRELTSS